MGLFNSLWQGAENIGDFIGLDGNFGYQGTWNTPAGLSAMQLNPRTAEMIANSEVPDSNSLAQYNMNNNSMFGGLHNWFNNTTSQDWSNYAKGLNAIGGLGLGYLNYKNANDMKKMYKQQMAFNQNQILRTNRRQEDADKSLARGFSNSALSRSL